MSQQNWCEILEHLAVIFGAVQQVIRIIIQACGKEVK